MGLEISGVGGVNYPSASENPQPFRQTFGLILNNLENYKADSQIPGVLLGMLQFAQGSISQASPNYWAFKTIMIDIMTEPTNSMYITASDLTNLKQICLFYSQASSAEFVFDPNPISRILQFIDDEFSGDISQVAYLPVLNAILGRLQILQNFTLYDSQHNYDLSTDALWKLNQAIETLKNGKVDLNLLVEVKLLVHQIVH